MPSPAPSRPHQLTQLHLPAEPTAWAAAGFDGGASIWLGNTALLPAADTPGLAATIDGIDDLDGLELAPALSVADPMASVSHRNTAMAIDHVVVMSPDCDRTTQRFESAGLEARRVRLIESASGTRRQTFFWMGDVVCEMVGPDVASGDGPATWWGLALTVRELDTARTLLGDHATDIKDAVQPGRQVCTVRSQANLEVPTLLISPHIEGVSSGSADG